MFYKFWWQFMDAYVVWIADIQVKISGWIFFDGPSAEDSFGEENVLVASSKLQY
jgi:hypothetical protein